MDMKAKNSSDRSFGSQKRLNSNDRKSLNEVILT